MKRKKCQREVHRKVLMQTDCALAGGECNTGLDRDERCVQPCRTRVRSDTNSVMSATQCSSCITLTILRRVGTFSGWDTE